MAVSDHTGSIVNPEGIHPKRLLKYVKENGGLAGYSGGKEINREEFFSTEVDIFIPAALETSNHRRDGTDDEVSSRCRRG